MPLKLLLAALVLAAVTAATASADSISCRVGYEDSRRVTMDLAT
jgi:hypothetical protein